MKTIEMLMNTDSSTVVTKCSRPSCSKVSRIEEEGSGHPILAVLRSTSPNEVSSPRGFCFGNRWFCSVECLEWGMGQEILQLFRRSTEKAIRARPRLGTILLAKKWITAEELRDALEAQRQHGNKLGHWLVRLGYITEEKLIMALSERSGIPWMSEIQQPFNKNTLSVLPKVLCKRSNVFPLEYVQNNRLVLAVDYGIKAEVTEAVEEVVGCKTRPFITRTDVLQKLISEHIEPQEDNTTDRIEERSNFANQVGHKFMEKWYEFEAEKARFGLFQDTLWVRYLKGEGVRDYFMLFDQPSAGVAPRNSTDYVQPGIR